MIRLFVLRKIDRQCNETGVTARFNQQQDALFAFFDTAPDSGGHGCGVIDLNTSHFDNHVAGTDALFGGITVRIDIANDYAMAIRGTFKRQSEAGRAG